MPTATLAGKLAAVRAAAVAAAAAAAQQKIAAATAAASVAVGAEDAGDAATGEPRVLRFKATQHAHGLAGSLPPLPLPVPRNGVARMRSGGSLCSLDTTATDCQVDLSAAAHIATPQDDETEDEDGDVDVDMDMDVFGAARGSFVNDKQRDASVSAANFTVDPFSTPLPNTTETATTTTTKTKTKLPTSTTTKTSLPAVFAAARVCADLYRPAETFPSETQQDHTTPQAAAADHDRDQDRDRDRDRDHPALQENHHTARTKHDPLISLTMVTSTVPHAIDEIGSLGLPAGFEDDALFADLGALPPLDGFDDDLALELGADLLSGLLVDEPDNRSIVVSAPGEELPPPPPSSSQLKKRKSLETAPGDRDDGAAAAAAAEATTPLKKLKAAPSPALAPVQPKSAPATAPVPVPAPAPAPMPPAVRPALPPPSLPGAPLPEHFDDLAMQIARQRTAESRQGAPRLVVQLEPMEQFYKDEGGAANFLFTHVELHGALDIQLFKGAETPENIATNSIPLEYRLELEDGTPLSLQEQRAVLRMVEPPALSMSRLHAVVKYRLLRVSKNFGGRRLRLVLWLSGCPGVQPVATVPVRVFSKRKKMCSAVRNRLTQVAVSRHVQRHLRRADAGKASNKKP